MPTVVAPHPVPQSNRPILASGIVVAAALPLFLIAGWPLAGLGDRHRALDREPVRRSGSPAASPRHG